MVVIECDVKCWCFNRYTMWALALQMEINFSNSIIITVVVIIGVAIVVIMSSLSSSSSSSHLRHHVLVVIFVAVVFNLRHHVVVDTFHVIVEYSPSLCPHGNVFVFQEKKHSFHFILWTTNQSPVDQSCDNALHRMTQYPATYLLIMSGGPCLHHLRRADKWTKYKHDKMFSNSLIIHEEKTKEIVTVKGVWLCDPS